MMSKNYMLIMMNYSNKKNMYQKSKIPFGSFITNYQSLFVNIYNDDKNKAFKKIKMVFAI